LLPPLNAISSGREPYVINRRQNRLLGKGKARRAMGTIVTKVNYRFLAHAVLSTDDAIDRMG
jgi:hypothetical protein